MGDTINQLAAPTGDLDPEILDKGAQELAALRDEAQSVDELIAMFEKNGSTRIGLNLELTLRDRQLLIIELSKSHDSERRRAIAGILNFGTPSIAYNPILHEG